MRRLRNHGTPGNCWRPPRFSIETITQRLGDGSMAVASRQSATTLGIRHEHRDDHFRAERLGPEQPHLPVLLYRELFADGGPTDFDRRFAANGWTGIWTNGVFDYQHYHSGAHEVLGIALGSATLLIGGPGAKQ